MNHQIRRLGRHEAALAEKVIRAFKGMSRSLDSLETFLGNPANYLLIAEVGDQAAGFLVAYRLERADREAGQMFVYEMAVTAAWQGQGLGTALVQKITALAQERECSRHSC